MILRIINDPKEILFIINLLPVLKKKSLWKRYFPIQKIKIREE